MNIEKIIREYINKSLHMSLGTVSNNKPWVCEVHFVYDNELNLYFRSLASRRHSKEIAKNPFVAGNIVAQHNINEYPQAIYFEGQAIKLNDPNDLIKVYPLFKDRLKADMTILEDAQKPDGHKFYKIVVNNWYAFGKFGQPSGQKYKLEWNRH